MISVAIFCAQLLCDLNNYRDFDIDGFSELQDHLDVIEFILVISTKKLPFDRLVKGSIQELFHLRTPFRGLAVYDFI